MTKKNLDETEFLVKLNDRLRQHAMYEPGMNFIAMPRTATDIYVTGFDWQGGKHHRRMFLEISGDVGTQFGLLESPQVTDRVANSGEKGFQEAEHFRDVDGRLYRYTMRYNAGPEPTWNARISIDGGETLHWTGTMHGNLHGGSALRAAMAAMIEALIDSDIAD